MTTAPPTPCLGHDDEHGNHHKCQRPDLTTRGKGSSGGRCASCAYKQRETDARIRIYRELAPDSAVPLHPSHIRPVTSYAITCANCGTALDTVSRESLAERHGGVYSCACGASWRITDKTLAEVAA